MDPDASAPAPQRLDSWLDVACLFKTRSAAAKACGSGRVAVNGERGKAHKLVRPGDRIEIASDFGRRRIVRVRGTAERSLPKAEARRLWDDETPAPTPEEIEARTRERLSRPRYAERPDARARRSIRRLKGR
ncbi:MAG TPA: S4 domain-containing protein [Thermoanaerobaculia bacterium]|nr:S4 domain-containing protein [Thermoanaerobaculia bacterium]